MLGYLWGAGNFGACVFSTNSHLITSAALEWWAATSGSLPQPIFSFFYFFPSQKYWRNNVSFKEELLVYFRMVTLFARIIYIPGNVESSQNLSRFIFSGRLVQKCFCIREETFPTKMGQKGLKLAFFGAKISCF